MKSAACSEYNSINNYREFKYYIQEVLERTVEMIEGLSRELAQAKVTIASQENTIRDLTKTLEILHRKNQALRESHFSPAARAKTPEPQGIESPQPSLPPDCIDYHDTSQDKATNSLPLRIATGNAIAAGYATVSKNLADNKPTPPSLRSNGNLLNGNPPALGVPHHQELVPACRITKAARALNRPDSAG